MPSELPLPPPEHPPPPVCNECGLDIDDTVQSPLAKYCRRCYFFNISLNQRRLQKTHASAAQCVLCIAEITADNKSPVVGCCYVCWTTQEAIASALQKQKPVPLEQESQKRKEPAAEQPEPCPERGWKRLRKESEMVWHARVQGFLDGPHSKKQKCYIDAWKQMPDSQKKCFRELVASKCKAADAPEEKLVTGSECGGVAGDKPWHGFSGQSRTICLPAGYNVDTLRKDFAEYASNPSCHDQSRWEMYCLIHMLIESPGSGLDHASQAEKELADLHINRKRLYQLSKNYQQPFPRDCLRNSGWEGSQTRASASKKRKTFSFSSNFMSGQGPHCPWTRWNKL